MGCNESREEKVNGSLQLQCTELMIGNLELFTLIEYLMAGKRGSPAGSLKVMRIKRRTEEYYEIVSKFRNYWALKCNRGNLGAEDQSLAKRFYVEQIKEREQLLECREMLQKALYYLYPDWNKDFNSVKSLKSGLEENTELMESLTSLYMKLYSGNKFEITQFIETNQLPLTQDIKDLISDLKSVTVAFYKSPIHRVYYTQDIEIFSRGKGSESEEITYNISQK